MCGCRNNFNIDISRYVFAKLSSSKQVLSIIFIATCVKGKEEEKKNGEKILLKKNSPEKYISIKIQMIFVITKNSVNSMENVNV